MTGKALNKFALKAVEESESHKSFSGSNSDKGEEVKKSD
tara:strand:- start:187 stop:303 length:117 start_codon:yes stop_codon:yes gene_type:complete